MTPRVAWVDVAKGAAISLVVFGHTWRGLYPKELIEENLFRSVDTAIYAFHMPLFFMISGFFFFRRSGGAALHLQMLDATRRLLVPLVLWTYIFLLVRWIFSDFTNSRPDVSSLFVLPVPGILHFWFLWALWIIQIGFLLFAALFPRRFGERGLILGALLLATVVWGYAPDLPYHAYLGAAYDHAVFFAAGAVLYRIIEVSRSDWIVAVVAMAIFVGLIFMTQTQGLSRMWAGLIALGLSVSFLVLMKWLTGIAPRGLVFLQWAGGFSFSIYMMHTIFSAGVREILLLAGITSLNVHLFLGVVVGIVCPICLSLIAARSDLGVILRR